MAKYLDLAGLASVWAKIKAALAKKQDALSQGTGIYIAGGEVSKREADFWATISTSGQYAELFKCAYTSTSNVAVKFSFACFSGNNKGMQFGTVAFKAYGGTIYEKASFWGGENLTADFGYRFGDDGYIHVYARQAGSGTVRLRGGFDNSNNRFNSVNCVPVNGSAGTRTDVTMIASQRYVSAATDGAVGSLTTPVYVGSDGNVSPITVADTVTGGSESPVTAKAVLSYTSAAVALAHSHANKSVLDGITADKVSAWDEMSADGGWIEISSSDERQCFYIGKTADGVISDQISSACGLIYVRTLTKSGLFSFDIHTRYSSGVRQFSCRRIDGDPSLDFGLYPVGMTEEPISRFGYYCCFVPDRHAVVRVKFIRTSNFTTGVQWVTDETTIANVRGVASLTRYYGEGNPLIMKSLPKVYSLSSGAGNITSTGGSVATSWSAYNSYIYANKETPVTIDFTVRFDITWIYPQLLTITRSVTVSLCRFADGAEIYSADAALPSIANGTVSATTARATIVHSIRFVKRLTDDSFRWGFKVKITAPSTVTLSSSSQLAIGTVYVDGVVF